MRLANLRVDGNEGAAVRLDEGYLPISALNARTGADWPEDVLGLIESGGLDSLQRWYESGGPDEFRGGREKDLLPAGRAGLGPLYRRPGKIWGIGLNYAAHAADLSESAPTLAPASFMKPFTTIIGPGDEIQIPVQSKKTTAEAELGLIMGRRCRSVDQENWLEVVAGFTCVIDMTAEDILRLNPRYLTLSKSFDTFFSFGPELVTPDEISDLKELNIATVVNGTTVAQNSPSNMTFFLDRLISFHSEVMTLLPGDVISTGTPGAAEISHGDIVECRIDGFAPLTNPVVDLKTV
ncbi:MAG: fumarylacetoacetate hydrolase family protein [Desulfobacteraceae bacterium]